MIHINLAIVLLLYMSLFLWGVNFCRFCGHLVIHENSKVCNSTKFLPGESMKISAVHLQLFLHNDLLWKYHLIAYHVYIPWPLFSFLWGALFSYPAGLNLGNDSRGVKIMFYESKGVKIMFYESKGVRSVCISTQHLGRSKGIPPENFCILHLLRLLVSGAFSGFQVPDSSENDQK